MTGGYAQFVRILESLQPVETRAIRCDVPLIRDATDDAWHALMAAKYGDDFETRDFTVGVVSA